MDHLDHGPLVPDTIKFQAAIGMIIFSGVLSLFLDIGKCIQRNRYKSYVDNIEGEAESGSK